MTKGQRANVLSKKTPTFLSSTLHTYKTALSREKLVPLAGISKVNTVLCKEDSGFVEYLSDRFGFNNEDSIWDNTSWNYVFLGDSFVHGFCVRAEDHFLSKFKKTYSNTANLGLYGAGPLSNLGVLLEYAKEHKPKRVVWVYLPTHLAKDFERENSIPELQKYQMGEIQELRKYQDQIDVILKAKGDKHIAESKYPNWKPDLNLFKLPLFMGQIDYWFQKIFHGSPEGGLDFLDFNDEKAIRNFPAFLRVLSETQKFVRTWKGELIFLILPDSNSFHPKIRKNAEVYFSNLKREVTNKNIQVLDFYSELAKEPEPFLFYSHLGRRYGHFNSLGYTRLANYLIESLKVMKPIESQK